MRSKSNMKSFLGMGPIMIPSQPARDKSKPKKRGSKINLLHIEGKMKTLNNQVSRIKAEISLWNNNKLHL